MALSADERDMLKEIRESQIRLEESFFHCNKLVREHQQTLHGNSHFGLVSKVRVLMYLVPPLVAAITGIVIVLLQKAFAR